MVTCGSDFFSIAGLKEIHMTSSLPTAQNGIVDSFGSASFFFFNVNCPMD